MAKSTNERILNLLKTRGALTAAIIARQLHISEVGTRKQLGVLESQGLVAPEDERGQVGRPKRNWILTETGHARFPDTHAHLTLELIGAAQSVFGDEGVEKLIEAREKTTLNQYRTELTKCRGLRTKVKRLAELRDEEGYMSDFEEAPDGTFLLIENHCPICAAARECQGFCRSELDLFQKSLGSDVTVERTDHIMTGARRCAYRISGRDVRHRQKTV